MFIIIVKKIILELNFINFVQDMLGMMKNLQLKSQKIKIIQGIVN